MFGLHTITKVNKISAQNCRLKSSLANFQIKGIVFNPDKSRLLFDLSSTKGEATTNKPTNVYITAEDDPAIEYSFATEVLSTATL